MDSFQRIRRVSVGPDVGMSDPAKKPGNDAGGKAGEFESFFGKGPISKTTARELLNDLQFAKEGDREAGIFIDRPKPAAPPAAGPSPAARTAPPVSLESLDHIEARKRVNAAQNVEEVVEAFLSYARNRFKRVALFVSRAPKLNGWDAAGGNWSRSLIRKVEIPLSEPSIFRAFNEGAGYYLGPIPKTAVNDKFVLDTGGARPKSCLIAPVLVGRRVVTLLYADNGHASEIEGDFSELLLFVLTVGRAYERLIRQMGTRTA